MKLFNAIVLSMLLSACATTRQVYLPTGGYAIDVNKGDRVNIVMNDGKTHSFQVTHVDEIGLSGGIGSFAYDEIQSVNVIEQGRNNKYLLWLILSIAVVAVLAEPDSNASGPLCLYASTNPNRSCL